MHGVQPANFTTQENEIVMNADSSLIFLRRSRFMQLPGEIRNRIYGFVFGAKSLRVFPTRLAVSTFRINMLPEATGLKPANSLKSREFYAFRQTCHPIADEADHYLFETLDLSNYDEVDSNIDRSGSSRAQHALFEEMMKDRWNHVRHLMIQTQMIQIEMIQTQMIQTFDMGRVISRVKGYLPRFPLLIESNGHMSYGGIAWPVDARNLTTLTIDDMEAREDEDGEKLLKVLGYYLPGLVDVRCSYERWGWPGDSSCMRRYRITSNGEMKW